MIFQERQTLEFSYKDHNNLLAKHKIEKIFVDISFINKY